VAPGQSGEKALTVAYEFRMELDRQMAISGFQSRGLGEILFRGEDPPRPSLPPPAKNK
jgi:hypothetical protein